MAKKKSPKQQKLEELLSSSRIVSGGFMGNDTRDIDEIIDEDLAKLAKTKVSLAQLAEKMKYITEKAKSNLENWIDIDEKSRAVMYEVKGILTCPWPHSGNYAKRVTMFQRKDLDKTLKWSDLNIHMIEQHGFFEGHGSEFRLDPKELAECLFDIKNETQEKLYDYRCLICCYIYEPYKNNKIPFDQLPDEWICPICGAPKTRFEILKD